MTRTPVSATDDFAYGSADAMALKLSLSIFADRGHVRDQLRDDVEAAGFRVAEATGLAVWRDDDGRALGDVVLLDIPEVDGAVLAALARIDLRAARAECALIVSTSVAALDDVFGCLDQSTPQILVNPSRAERLIALGQILMRMPGGRVRELSEDDRMLLLRLTEQVGRMAQTMERFSGPERDAPASGSTGGLQPGEASAFNFSPAPAAVGERIDDLVRTDDPPVPDARLVRRIIRQRQSRARFFEGDLFADPAWDMLLDLTAARSEAARVSVTSLCIASGVPPTTALRWISQMTEAGLLQRNEDQSDRRRAFITLTDKASLAMARYFAQLGSAALVI